VEYFRAGGGLGSIHDGTYAIVVIAVPATFRSPVLLIEVDTGASRRYEDSVTALQSYLGLIQGYNLRANPWSVLPPSLETVQIWCFGELYIVGRRLPEVCAGKVS
jgi:hypothetical protein